MSAWFCRILLGSAVVFGGALPGLGGSAFAADLSVSDAFSRATPGRGPGVAYLTIHGGEQPDRLVGVSSPRAEKVEIHTMSMRGDVMEMRQIDALEIPANHAIALAPGGLHLMLTGLKAPLKAGETVPLVLTFQKAGTRSIDVPVGTIGANGPVPGQAMPGMAMPGMAMPGMAMPGMAVPGMAVPGTAPSGAHVQ